MQRKRKSKTKPQRAAEALHCQDRLLAMAEARKKASPAQIKRVDSLVFDLLTEQAKHAAGWTEEDCLLVIAALFDAVSAPLLVPGLEHIHNEHERRIAEQWASRHMSDHAA